MRSILDSAPFRIGLVLIAVLILQLTLIPNMQIAGASADLMLLFTLTISMAAGPDLGAIAGFAFGMIFDLTLQTPFGLSALVYSLAGYGVGVVHSGMSRVGWRITTGTLALSTALSVALYALLARVFGEAWLPPGELLRVILVEAAFNAFLGPVALRVSRWAVADAAIRPRRSR